MCSIAPTQGTPRAASASAVARAPAQRAARRSIVALSIGRAGGREVVGRALVRSLEIDRVGQVPTSRVGDVAQDTCERRRWLLAKLLACESSALAKAPKRICQLDE